MARKELWEVMQRRGIREGLTERARETYRETKCKVSWKRRNSEILDEKDKDAC